MVGSSGAPVRGNVALFRVTALVVDIVLTDLLRVGARIVVLVALMLELVVLAIDVEVLPLVLVLREVVVCANTSSRLANTSVNARAITINAFLIVSPPLSWVMQLLLRNIY